MRLVMRCERDVEGGCGTGSLEVVLGDGGSISGSSNFCKRQCTFTCRGSEGTTK